MERNDIRIFLVKHTQMQILCLRQYIIYLASVSNFSVLSFHIYRLLLRKLLPQKLLDFTCFRNAFLTYMRFLTYNSNLIVIYICDKFS